MNRTRRPRQAAQDGFTLIELMVGVLLGLLTTLVVAQVMFLSEGHKRSTTAGSDAQMSGALGLYAVQQEAQMAGYGVSASLDALGCHVNFKYDGVAGNFTLAPVYIDAGSNGSNVLTVLRSAKPSFALPMRVTESHTLGLDYFVVQSTVGVDETDLFVAVPEAIGAGRDCRVLQVRANAARGLTTSVVPHIHDDTTPWNPLDAATDPATIDYPAGSYLINLGKMSLRQFSVDAASRSLQARAMANGRWGDQEALQSQVVVFKALYGKDNNDDGTVDRYDTTTPTTNADWRRVKSVRLLVIARSDQREKDVVTTADSATGQELVWNAGSVTVEGATTCHGSSQCVGIDLEFLGSDWNHYRYKLFDTVVPLRNVVWSGD